MGLFTSKKKTALNSLRAQGLTLADAQSFLAALNLDSDISENKLYSATYYACMDIRCKALAKLPIKIIKTGESGTEKQDSHYLYSLLKRRPNPYISTTDFLFACEFQKLEHGNAFIYAPTMRGKVTGLYILDSTRMQIVIDNTGLFSTDGTVKENMIWYSYTDINGKQYMFNYKEIVHLKNFSKDGIVGTPIKKYLAETIQNEQYASKFTNNYWKNGVQGRAVLQYTGDIGATEREKMRGIFESMVSGVKNSGRIIPVAMGYELKEFNPKLVDSQFFELSGMTIKHIANAFGVKLYQLNSLEQSTYSNIESQNRAFLSDTLEIVLVSYEQEFEYKLLTTKELSGGYSIRFNLDGMLRSDLATRMTTYQAAIQNGVYTPADARRLEDMPFIEGSDVLVFNGALIPVANAGKQVAVPAAK
ncbi:phage portal protein [Paenibacillus sp. 19GGS1-52]|uniref:phage portal protein n=1 Tax=Paenibacillus sp. 19GGS1-52 TaxID=2758563 RepID=UPI001EFA991F|nr:phage portal protein [Paenibacillus sp. 19GGS1-52]ULO09663.1 phage portal protein [Paenibacillus sp. 19GGS1-52]